MLEIDFGDHRQKRTYLHRILRVRLVPHIESDKEIHEQRGWVHREVARYYAQCRRDLASVNQVLDIWLRGPRCADCDTSVPFGGGGMPAISATSWEEDIAIEVGEETLEEIKAAIAADEDPLAWECVDCHCSLRPWAGDDVWVASKHLEEGHSVPFETGPKRAPSAAMRRIVLDAYGHSCFGCGVSARRTRLTIDHIIPRSRGGDAAFRNLQPLCHDCQQRKADAEGETVEVHDNMYFRCVPGDTYEGLFW